MKLHPHCGDHHKRRWADHCLTDFGTACNLAAGCALAPPVGPHPLARRSNDVSLRLSRRLPELFVSVDSSRTGSTRRLRRSLASTAAAEGHSCYRFSGWELAVVVLSVLYLLVYAWPATGNPWRWLWGGEGDGLGNAFLYTWIDDAIRAGQSLAIDPSIAIPFGDQLGSMPHEPLYFGAQVLLGLLIGPVGALNVITFAAVPLSSWLMYRLTLRLTTSPPAAFCTGIAFGCSSFVLIHTRGEATLVQVWVFPLTALALLEALHHPRTRSAIAAAIAIGLCAMVNFYFSLFLALMCLVLVVAWLLAAIIAEHRFRLRSLAVLSIAGTVGAMIAGSVYLITLGNLQQRAAPISRAAARLNDLAPVPVDFVLPSRFNPWVGSFGEAHFEQRLRATGLVVDLADMSIPIAMVVLAVAGLVILGFALYAWHGPSRTMHVFEFVSMSAVGLLGLVLTVPPRALPHRLRFLSVQYDIHAIFPQYQHFHRAIVLVWLGVAALGALALAALFRRWPALTFPVAFLVTASVLVENYAVVPLSAREVVPPPAYAWIAARPGDYAVAEYPLVPPDSGGNELAAVFNQRFHGRPLLNGIMPDTESNSMRDELRNPNLAGVPGRLAALGVRYVVWSSHVLEQLNKLNPTLFAPYYSYRPAPPQYRREAAFADGSAVYSVQELPDPVFAFYARGVSTLATDADGQQGRWLIEPSLQIVVVNIEPRREVSLAFDCVGSDVARRLELIQAGRTLGAFALPIGGRVPILSRVDVPSGLSRLAMAVTDSLPGGKPPRGSGVFCTLIRAA